MNICTFPGNIARDSELKYTQSGTAISSFTIANNTGYGDRQKTLWIRCTLFGKRAESIDCHLIKGKKVLVSGELSENEWTTQEGEARKSLELRVNEIVFIGNGGQRSDESEEQPPMPEPRMGDGVPF